MTEVERQRERERERETEVLGGGGALCRKRESLEWGKGGGLSISWLSACFILCQNITLLVHLCNSKMSKCSINNLHINQVHIL